MIQILRQDQIDSHSGKIPDNKKGILDENRKRYFLSSSLIFWNCSLVISPFAYRSFRISSAVFP